MTLLDVKYVVVVEFINDVSLTDSVSFFATEASYAAALAMSIEKAAKIMSAGRSQPYQGVLGERRVTKVTYGPV